MKKITYLLLFALVAVLMPLHVQANDYLELQKHYSVYAAGANSIHFKIPVWAYGKGNNYYLYNSSASYIVITKDSSGKPSEGSPVQICRFESEPYGENDNLDSQKGTAWMSMMPGQGVAVVTSMYDGSRLTIHDTGNMEFAMVVQKEDDDCPHVSMLEFDWFPPESLNEKEFVIQLNLFICKSYSESVSYVKCFRFSGPFTGGNNLMAPQLSEPYLYTVNATGVTGYGQAAIQYTTFQKPLWYFTSKAPNDTVTISDQAGTIYVNTSDTVQEQFTATFQVYREEALKTTSIIAAPPVDIPPFHRIYDFKVTEETDTFGSLTGNNKLEWSIKNPQLKDLVENDYFEIQRATKADFSDAQTLNVMSMQRGEQSLYSYVDDSYRTKTVTASATTGDTIYKDSRMSVYTNGVVLRDAQGKPMCEMNMWLYASNLVMPSAPVYYRIRRAASSLWGWNHDFAISDTVYKHNYLAPLATEQANYRLDRDYATNRTVHFDFRLENAEIGYKPISLDNCELWLSRVRTMGDTVEYTAEYNPISQKPNWIGWYVDGEMIPAEVYVYAEYEGEELFGPAPGRLVRENDAPLRMPIGSTVRTTVVPQVTGYTVQDNTFTFRIEDHRLDKIRFRVRDEKLNVYYSSSSTYSRYGNFEERFTATEQARIKETETSLKQMLLPSLIAQNQSFGRCLWDKTARLVLCRTLKETGQTIEIIVPQDSIRRQEDGSWLAHMTDVAGEPCTHYSYAVRIDQSDASIHVSDSVYLKPVSINGPNLYFDESAEIVSFTASQGQAQGVHKNGISLVWKASSAAVDEYILTRIVKNSDQVPDTILRTVDNNYLDESAKPDVHYEYTITASYSCNGKHTVHSATAEGWRTPYGQISGNILMTDNSGMSGVQVSLSADGKTVATMMTDATGAYLFDSLRYDLEKGTVYTIIPTSQYGTFSYNNTSSGVASVSLAADRAIVSGIDFVNTSSVRLSGRVLYDHSSIPVAGAAFVLNGDTIRRNGSPLLSGNDGAFELSVSKSQVLRLQVCKSGHTFLNEGWLFVTGTDTAFSLVKPLDGVRFYDATKVRLVGRVAGGNDQKALRHGFGLGKNNLGDDLQLVLQLEGDNTAHIVHDPEDLTRDTLHFETYDYSGHTETLFEQKRIIIRPDVQTGEYTVDLFPVKYKVVQATAKGYATLFANGTGSETFDLTNAPLTLVNDSLEDKKVSYNAVYDRIYHNPVQVNLTQLNYGMEADGLGEKNMQATSINPFMENEVTLYTKEADGTVDYLLGYPVFTYNRRYQFMASAYEEYRYNNDPAGAVDRVPQRGGSITVQNGMAQNTPRQTYALDSLGRNKGVWLTVDYIDVQNAETNALRTVSIALESEGNTVDAVAFRAFVEGTLVQPDALHSTDAEIKLLDIIRDPGGSGSSAYVESGTTYKCAYAESYHWKAGLNIGLSWAAGITQDIGVVAAPAGAGSYIGATYSTKRELSFDLPIVHEWKWGYKYDYTITTTNRISTSSAANERGVGSNADVFLGTTISQVAGKAKTVSVITDSLYQARQPAIQAGTMKVLAQGADSLGRGFYLVTGEKVVLGSALGNTFAYSQDYIHRTLIPSLILERQNMLMDFATEEEAKAAANASGEPVYWNLRTASVNPLDTLADKDYQMVIPDDNKAYINRVKALDRMIWQWTTLIYTNEKEKVMARTSGKALETYSVSFGNTFTHSDSYSSMYNYNEMPQGKDLIISEIESGATGVATDLMQSLTNNSSSFLKGMFDSNIFAGDKIGTSVADAIKQYYKNDDPSGQKRPDNKLGTTTNNSEFDYEFLPVVSFDCDDNLSKELTQKKTAGFTLVPDDQGMITVSIYRANVDSLWKEGTQEIRETVKAPDELYGSYVYFTQSGSSLCPYEPEERTLLYNPGTIIGNATEYVGKPELSIDTYEQTNVPSDQRAKFRIELKNNGQVETGAGASGQFFTLYFNGETNPDGAKVFLNGAALNQAVVYYMKPGQSITQVIEVEKGEADDYQNLELNLALQNCPKHKTALYFSVHFMPESSPVNIAFPRDKWVMNTLSARDSVGYYLPVTIDGFNIHHKNFDHIEFQYKLSTENNDAWVTQCSFFADDSLFNNATGNKAMIENGRITPFRFYGERDPKELNYDLRAVSFCRYGSGFVTKESPVISGVKDTRPPVLFGKPLPANGILTLDGDIKLRFSEPIAGNWLDEDNNFQVLGVTNATGITQTTSLYFDGKENHYAASLASRELAITDLTVDMLIKPAEKGREMILFSHGNDNESFAFSLTADNRLKLSTESEGKHKEYLSLPMDELSSTDFTRVIMAYELFDNSIRFYAGTKDITDNDFIGWVMQNEAAPLRFGCGLNGEKPFHGNMMEVRIWTKALSPAEIANTHLRRLTGYEHGLMAYYPMTESKGTELDDLASGATLKANGLSWTNPQGISLATNGQKVRLQPTLFSRTEAEDYTFMCWFRSDNASSDEISLFGTAMGDSVTMQLTLHDGSIRFTADDVDAFASADLTDGNWHHCVLVVSKTYNAGSLYIDGQLKLNFPTIGIGALSGTSVWLADGLEGNIDDVCLFEQALPAELIAEFGKQTPNGEEMGLINLLTFSCVKRNASGVMEQVFSPDNQRVFRDANGNVVSKVQPLLVDDLASQADKSNYAPVRDRGLLTNLPFNWTYQESELLINIKAQPREINKRTMYLTVRDVEDLNGNRQPSPVMWTVYANLNSIVWSAPAVRIMTAYEALSSFDFEVFIINQTGMTRQYTIDQLPTWLTVSSKQGTLEAEGNKMVTFSASLDLKPGLHNHVVYLTDDQGLSAPLLIEVEVFADCPYEEPETNKYPYNMSLCGQVMIDDAFDTDPNDKVIALYNNECVGMANVDFDNVTNKSRVFLTIFGDDKMNRKPIQFRLWQASTGKVYDLSPSSTILFAHGAVYGCGDSELVILTTNGNERQTIKLNAGWNWASFNLDLRPYVAKIDKILTADQPWSEGDLIKNPATRHFTVYSDSLGRFVGDFDYLRYIYTYMIYSENGNTMHISGNNLHADSMYVTVAGNGQWSALPCLLREATPLQKALGDYYDYASTGDLIKAHNRFAYFSEDKKWVGDLTSLRPGEGYFLRRLAPGKVKIRFFNQSNSNAPKRAARNTEGDPSETINVFTNPQASTNMTMIARIEGLDVSKSRDLEVFVGDELAAVATPIDSLYFLTIQSDRIGELRFEMEGETYVPVDVTTSRNLELSYSADSHHGTLDNPIVLIKDDNRPRKIIENNHIVIIRNNEKYDVTGKKR